MNAAEMECAAVMEESLYAVAESGEDITPHFFRKFFTTFPDQLSNFQNPRVTCGSMAIEILDTLFGVAKRDLWVPNATEGFVIAHRSYGDIAPFIYNTSLDLFIDTLADLAGNSWTADYDAAWRAQAETLKVIIAQADHSLRKFNSS